MAAFMNEFEHLKIQLEEIKSATNNFDQTKVIGSGSFGKVYKGEVCHSKGKSLVAVKRLDRESWQGDHEFLKEVTMLSRYSHENLISLLGFCDEAGEKILVYEYASNRSLDHHLSSKALTWSQRIKICLDAARGLCYLHDDIDTHQRVLHRDIKSANILLDEKWTAKISDLGLSKMGPANQQHTALVTDIVGTFGYLDPMYLEMNVLTKESDVYSLGVVLMEVLCGKLCFLKNINGTSSTLVQMWKKSCKAGQLDKIVFQDDVMQPLHPDSLQSFSKIALQCLNKYREGRPLMSLVVKELETSLKIQESHDVSRSRMSTLVAMEAWANQRKGKKQYLVLISLHGLIRGEDMELGRDSDTGDQAKYVVELAKALASMPGVYRVDLLTRRIACPEVDLSYDEPTEMLADVMTDEIGESSGAYIIRIPFGPKDKYIPKELLWPHIPEFVDGALSHVIQMSKVLGQQVGGGHPVWPVAIHGHYADAGDSAARLSGALNVPMIFTGHSLGRDELEHHLRQGRLTKDEIDTTYKVMRRIEAEETSLDASEVVITSTRQEIEEHWWLYNGFDPVLEKKLRERIKRNVSCYGRFMSRMVVIPPGTEFNHIVPQDVETAGEDHHSSFYPPIWNEITRFFANPRKPMILALARPDPIKNLTTLVKAFGECRPLRELANLTLIMGNRDNFDDISSTSDSMLHSVISMIDKYDLYGQVAYPKHYKQVEVTDIYRLAAKTKGVLINPAFIEPFGLTLIEAAAHGLPMVATKNWGPVDIHRVLDNGLLIDPNDQHSIANALLELVADKQLWSRCRANGLRNIQLFSWTEHCKTYLSRIDGCEPRHPRRYKNDDDDVLSYAIGVGKSAQRTVSGEKSGQLEFPALSRRKQIFFIAIDDDDIGCVFENVNKIFKAVENERIEGSIGFILATSLQMAEVHSFFVSKGVNPSDFDAFICNSGADLYYSSSNSGDTPFVHDLYYHSHIQYRWGGEGLKKTLVSWASSIIDKRVENKNEEHVVTEDEEVSSDYCYAFNIHKAGLVPPVKELQKLMRIQALRCHIIYCQNGKKINVIPVSASRSQALRYLYLQWGMDLSKVVVFVGESGDTDYEGFLGGVHKSVILKGVGSSSTSQLHANRVYPLSDVTLITESPNLIQTPADCSSADIRASLGKLGILKP